MKIAEDYAMLQQDLATDVTNMMLTGFASSRLAAAGELATLIAASDRSTSVLSPFALPAGFSPVGRFGTQ